jgi:hypothetical protein
MVSINKQKIRKNKIAAIVIAILVIGVLLLALELTHVTNFYKKKTTDQPIVLQDKASKLDLSPPTDAEKKAGDEQKAKIKENGDGTIYSPTPSTGSTQNRVKPVITYAGQYGNKIEVGSYVPGVYETGTCSITLSNGNQQVTRSNTASKEGRSTVCPAFSIDRSEFPQSGTWTATVSYSSSTTKGDSDTKSLEVH